MLKIHAISERAWQNQGCFFQGIFKRNFLIQKLKKHASKSCNGMCKRNFKLHNENLTKITFGGSRWRCFTSTYPWPSSWGRRRRRRSRSGWRRWRRRECTSSLECLKKTIFLSEKLTHSQNLYHLNFETVKLISWECPTFLTILLPMPEYI